MRSRFAALANTIGLLLGLGLGLVLMPPAVSALGTLPILSLLSPNDGSNVSGTVTFVAAADSAGLVSLQFRVDGSNYGSPITSGACRAMFDTGAATAGPHTVQAVARDEFGNTVMSQPATVFVNNLVPAVFGVVATNLTASSATITWTTVVVADSQVEYGLTPAYTNAGPRDYSLVQQHVRTLTGLEAGSTYHFRALSVGQNGVLSSSGDLTFRTASPSGSPPVPSPTPTPTPVPSPTPLPSPGPTPKPSPSPPPGGGGLLSWSDAGAASAAVPRRPMPTPAPPAQDAPKVATVAGVARTLPSFAWTLPGESASAVAGYPTLRLREPVELAPAPMVLDPDCGRSWSPMIAGTRDRVRLAGSPGSAQWWLTRWFGLRPPPTLVRPALSECSRSPSRHGARRIFHPNVRDVTREVPVPSPPVPADRRLSRTG